MPLRKSGDKQYKLKARWETGVFLGIREGTDEFFIGTKDGGDKGEIGEETPAIAAL